MKSTVRLMTHNVWNNDENHAAWEARGQDCSAEVRQEGLLRTHRECMPDVIGCQELSQKMAGLLGEGLTKDPGHYAMIEGGFTSIFYRVDRLTVLESDFCRYPERVEGYEGIFNDAGSKSYCIGVFEAKESGKRFIFASTHLWWKRSPTEGMKPPYPANYQIGSDEVRAQQIKTLVLRIEDFREKYKCPAFIVGDLNAGYDSPAV